MDNVVQNISMEDIIPSNFQPTNEEERKIEELAQLMKSFGMIDPIIVRTKNGKYEIVLGMEKYQAAKLAGLTTVPAIIKEIDDEAFSKYLNVEKKQLVQEEQTQPQYHQSTERNDNLTIPLEKQQTSVDNLPTPEWQRKGFNTNPDIVNLAELSKINLEYERDDLKMNNGQMNNNMMNNNLGQTQPTQGPTFGGRFFPSLEDEPTNMNMMGGISTQSPVMEASTQSPEIPNMNNNIVNTNNLIDLTDLSIDKEPAISSIPDFAQPVMTQQAPEIKQPINDIKIPQTDFGMSGPTMAPQPEFSSINSQPEVPGMSPKMTSNPVPTPDFTAPQIQSFPQMDNIISLENLQNNNSPVQPISEPVPTPLATLNEEFGAPSPIQPPQFDMSQNIAPQIPSVPEVNIPMNDIQIPQTDFAMNGPAIVPQPEIPNITSHPEVPGMTPSMMSDSIPTPLATLNEDFGAPAFVNNTVPTMGQTKDITPVTNTIKSLVSSLEAFDYKININEEELPTSIKLTIEVER